MHTFRNTGQSSLYAIYLRLFLTVTNKHFTSTKVLTFWHLDEYWRLIILSNILKILLELVGWFSGNTPPTF